MKTIFIKIIAVAYLFLVSIPLTLLVYLLCYVISFFSYLKNLKNEKTKQNFKKRNTD
jgi:hypothetical protein